MIWEGFLYLNHSFDPNAYDEMGDLFGEPILNEW